MKFEKVGPRRAVIQLTAGMWPAPQLKKPDVLPPLAAFLVTATSQFVFMYQLIYANVSY